MEIFEDMDIPSPAGVVPLLRGIPIFSDLDEAAIRQLAGRCVSRTVNSGHLLFTTGEECRGLYIIESGQVRIYRDRKSTRLNSSHANISYAVFCLKKKTIS